MSEEQNMAIVRRYTKEVVNTFNLVRTGEFVAKDYVNHNPFPGQPPGIRGIVEIDDTIYRPAFPDWHVTIEDMIAAGDKVVIRLTVHATQKGEFLGIPSTGKRVTYTAIEIMRLANGKIVERWAEGDKLGLFQQLRVVPRELQF